MEATRYFEMMHHAMSARSPRSRLLLQVDVQDVGGADAVLELRRDSAGRTRVFASTMGRRNLNFLLFRKGWQQCHNASGELTGRFPARAEALLDESGLDAYIRDDVLDEAQAEYILQVLRRCGGGFGGSCARPTQPGAWITVESFVGAGGRWSCQSGAPGMPVQLEAVLCWLGDWLAGPERRTLQSWPEAVRLAAQWQAELTSPFARPVQDAAQPASPARPAVRRAAPGQPVQNPRWQSILAVLATV